MHSATIKSVKIGTPQDTITKYNMGLRYYQSDKGKVGPATREDL